MFEKKWEDGHSEGCDRYVRWKILQKMNGGIYQNTSLQCVVAYWQIRGGGSKPPISSVMVAY